MHGGSFYYTEILFTLSSSCVKQYSSLGSVRRIQDPTTQGYVVALRQGKMKIPKTEQGLDLRFNYLAIQGYFTTKEDYSIQILITCKDGIKRKLYFVSVSEIKIFESYSIIPNLMIPAGIWINVCIDMNSFIEYCFGTQMDYVDSILVSGNCKLRVMFSLKFPLNDSVMPMGSQNRNYLLPAFYDIPNANTLLVNIYKFKNKIKNDKSISYGNLDIKKVDSSINNTFSHSNLLAYRKYKQNKNSEYYKKLIDKIIKKRLTFFQGK